FLTRAAKAYEPGCAREYRFVCGLDPPLLAPLNALLRLADEAAGVAARFHLLAEVERREGTEEILATVGETACTVLRMVTIEQVSERQLARAIQRAAATLAGPVAGKQLVEMLFSRISEAMARRGRLD